MRTLRTWRKADRPLIEELMRRAFLDREVERHVQRIVEDVEKRGDEAVADYAARYDNVSLRPDQFRVRRQEMLRAKGAVDRAYMSVFREVKRNLLTYHKRQKPSSWKIGAGNGGSVGERWIPLGRVGLYVPAGQAPLVSTVLMGVVPAKVAGVREIMVCSPPTSGGEVDPYVLATCAMLGVEEVYRVGGAQAIAAMAIGTKTVAKVDKIVGPGGIYVTVAKKILYGRVGIDLVAGPSEVLIVADESADATYIATDLLSQAEHGTGREVCVLVTDSESLAVQVDKRLRTLVDPGAEGAFVGKKGLLSCVVMIVSRNLAEAVRFANEFAAEHVEVMTKKASSVAGQIESAGAIFIGKYSPVPIGDFYAGPNHVLPTGGAARFLSGLSVTDFMKRMGVISYSKRSLERALPAVVKMAEVEKLEGHAEAVRTRFTVRK